jgi:PAS domain S-box-containing protein
VREVSGKAARTVLEVIEEAGFATAPLAARLPFSLAMLREAPRLDWDAFAAFIEGVDEIYGDRLSIEEIGLRVLRAPSFQFLRHAGQLLVSPRQLYTLAHRMVAPAMFANITVTQEWLPSGRLEVIGELALDYRGSEAVFRLCHANVIALPRLLDLPPAKVEQESVTGRRGRLVVLPPKSHTIAARLRRGARAAVALRHAFRVVVKQQEELEGSLAALRSSRHELRQLIERMPDGVLLHRDGIVSWANAAMLTLLGYERLEQVVGRPILDFVPEADRAPLAAAMAKARPNQTSDEWLEYRMLRSDGSIRRVQASAVPNVELDGTPARLVVLRDITEQHRLHEQLVLGDRMASLGRLAAGVAHEINNPLAYMHTSLEVASRDLADLDDPRTATIAESLARAKDGAQRVRGIVRDLKMLSRAEDEPSEAVDLATLLDSTLALAANAIGPKASVVRCYGDAPRAQATRGRLGQVFLNLLLNAADAIPDDDPSRHEIRVTTLRDAAGRAVAEIADTGMGIAPALADRIFDPFFTTKSVGAGTGLGLAICHRIVTQLGGEITFSSAPGKGTTFRVTLPASDAAAVESIAHTVARSRGRVLVVDDEPTQLRTIDALICDQHDVVTVSSGRQALDMLRTDGTFDVIVADLMMAEVTGMDLYDAVRADHPGLERQFLFMTGGAFTAASRRFLDSIPNRCVDKPFDGDELIDAIAEVIERRPT